MKSIWARIGVKLNVTAEEYEVLKKKASYVGSDGITRFGELTLNDDEINRFFHLGVPDGDSYIPQEVFENIEWNKEE